MNMQIVRILSQPLIGVFAGISILMAPVTQAFGKDAIVEEQRPLVIFFGGFGYNGTRSQKWLKAAISTEPGFEFVSIPFPTNAPARPSKAVVGAGQNQIKEALDLIAENPRRKILVVGHSSGSALADTAIAMAVRNRTADRGRVKEILLEGFRPQSGYKDLACWTAVGAPKCTRYERMPGRSSASTNKTELQAQRKMVSAFQRGEPRIKLR
jgi:hypothetical protein